jgi:prepilin-type N-terminal cleavage/methylation domain-containing protein
MVFPFSKKAFTLVELLVVIAIVGLLSTIVLAVTSGVSEQGRIAKGLQFSQHLENSLGDHLVGRWTFDEDPDLNLCGAGKVCDTSGWNNHGTMHNFVLPYGLVDDDTPSDQGWAMKFDGEDDYVDCGSNPIFNFTDENFTFEAWIKPNAVSGTDQIMHRHSWNSSGYRWQINDGNRMSFYTFQSGVFQTSGTSAGSITLEEWNHVAVVRIGSSVKLYVDGKDKTTVFGNHIDPASRLGTLQISNSYYPEAYSGLIDGFFIYNTALTVSQIKSQYYVGLQNLLAKGQITEQEYFQRLTMK